MTVLGFGARVVKEFDAFRNAPKATFQFRALVTASVGDQNTSVDASFRGAPNARYTLTPADQKRVGGLIGADVMLPVSERTAIFAGGTAEFKGGDNNYTANMGVRYTF